MGLELLVTVRTTYNGRIEAISAAISAVSVLQVTLGGAGHVDTAAVMRQK